MKEEARAKQQLRQSDARRKRRSVRRSARLRKEYDLRPRRKLLDSKKNNTGQPKQGQRRRQKKNDVESMQRQRLSAMQKRASACV